MKSCPLLPTHSGLHVDPFALDPSLIREEDIVHSLSNQCRYTGHTSRFYSVAEHALHVAHIVAILPSGSRKKILQALHHEDAEYVFSDIHVAIKSRPEICDFLVKAETDALCQIFAAKKLDPTCEQLPPFAFLFDIRDVVRRVDIGICYTEMKTLKLPIQLSAEQELVRDKWPSDWRMIQSVAAVLIKEAADWTTFQTANIFAAARKGDVLP